MHHGQGAMGGGGGIHTADFMNPKSKMKVGTCLGGPAIVTAAREINKRGLISSQQIFII